MKKYRFHVLGIPHTITSKEYNACAFTQKVLKFCQMMSERGHYIIHYGHEKSRVKCNEHVTIITSQDLERTYPNNWKKDFFKFNTDDYCYKKFSSLGIIEVKKRLNDRDFVLAFFGLAHKKLTDEIKKEQRAIILEPGIGYKGVYCDFRVYESYAWMHYIMGIEKLSNPNWFHVVIPNYFDINDFTFSSDKKDYFLYLGRISKCKGVDIAIQVTQHLDEKLVIAGQGDIYKELGYSKLPKHVTCVGYADIEQRRELMRDAKGLFLLSNYVEPFGGVCIESLLSGTPIITSDWGAFTEFNIHSVTGYRVRNFDHLIWAAKNISNIDPVKCRKYAEENFSFEKVGQMYEEYFHHLYTLWDKKGWYSIDKNRTSLDWLTRNAP